ncbi:MAG: phosphatase PAP2 family protein [Bacilli bacterium]|nr:phosphatase PAP2 family protein [Bacilli bacterium]
MKKMRIPLYCTLGVAIIGLIFGSIFDYQISSAIASPTSTLGLTISTIGPTIGFCGLVLIGGAFIGLALQKEWKPFIRILFLAAAIAAYVCGVIFAGQEYFSVNGFYGVVPKFVGYIITAVVFLGVEFLGYIIFKDNTYKDAWVIYLILMVVVLLALVPETQILKSIFHRPRFRTVIQGNVPFHNWWQRCGNYKEYMETYGYISEEFKSFPSGHTGDAAMSLAFATFAPLAYSKLRKIQLPLFIGCFVFTMIVGLGRILAAAHYLSDVSMGAILMLVTSIIANEIVIHIKFFHKEEQIA